MILQRAELISTKALHVAQAFGCTVCIFPVACGYEQWAATVTKYHGQRNTEALLREKSIVQATFIIYNLDIAPEIHDMAKASNAESPSSCPKLSDEQKAPLRLEEAALRCRVIAELAQRCLGQEPSCLFMDNLLNDILHILVLQGYSPSVTPAALVDRIKEYSQYKKWTRKKEKARLALCYGKQANIF